MTQSVDARDATARAGDAPAPTEAGLRVETTPPVAPALGTGAEGGGGKEPAEAEKPETPQPQAEVHVITRREARLLRLTGLLGALLTLLVVCLDVLGLLVSMDLWLYDQRAQSFQIFTPPPGDRVVHVDIDDKALEVIGRWPWHRSDMAKIVDEMRLAGAAVIGVDIIFPEAEDLEYRPEDPSRPNASPLQVIDHDRELARSVKQHGK